MATTRGDKFPDLEESHPIRNTYRLLAELETKRSQVSYTMHKLGFRDPAKQALEQDSR